MNHHMPFIRSPRDDGRLHNNAHPRSLRLSTSSLALKKTLMRSPSSTLSNSNTHSPGRRSARGLTLPSSVTGAADGAQFNLSLLAASEHRTHNKWLRRIRRTWNQIE